jgi:hypothetical protein
MPGVGLTIGGKAAFLHLRPWVDFVKEQKQHRLSCGENELCIFIFK